VVLELLRGGASAIEAAAATGVNVNTVRSWVRRYPEFPTARRPVLKVVEGRAGVPDRAELLELLTVQARNGSVRAIELLMREVPAQATADVAPDLVYGRTPICTVVDRDAKPWTILLSAEVLVSE